MLPDKLLQQATPIITKIAKEKSRRGFAYFTGDDVGQEVWIICLNALKEYSPSIGPLENFLRRCVTNRLKNLKRDKYFRLTSNDGEYAQQTITRINLVNAVPLGHHDVPEGAVPMCASRISDPSANLIYEEMIAFIEHHLDEQMLIDFKKINNGERIQISRIKLLEPEIKRLIKEFNDG